MSQPRCRIVEEPIDPTLLLARAVAPADGAALLFLGVVRDRNDGRDVGHLDYRAYVPMAERVLEEIVAEAEARWSTGAIHAVHRVGRLEVGEASVAVVVASPHRAEAYEASRYVVEELKRRLPVWKREGYRDGGSEWLPGHSPAAAPEAPRD